MAANGDAGMDLAARVEQLTAKQRECLELVDDHATSKEIARRLGISRHTVDARLRSAIQILGVGSRREAAVIYRAAIEADSYQSFTYQSPQVAATGVNPSPSLHDDHANPHPAETPRAAAMPGAACGFDAGADDAAGISGARAADTRAVGTDGVGMGAGRPDSPAAHRSFDRFADQYARADHVADGAAWSLETFGAMDGAGHMHPRFRLWGGSNDLTPAQRVAGIFIVTILAMLAFGTFLSGIEALTLLHS